MLRIKPLLVLCAALLTFTPAASADVNSDMNQFFNKLGFASNTTQPGVWQGQAAGYAYGGSLYARTQVKNIQLISMTLPDINADVAASTPISARSVLLMAISCSVLLSRL
ncbi:conjugative transfer pilus assembly protein TraH [Klebsiella pneumoniae MGH 59]|nr:conjugative transfer pilus assembly protein TraH [Klebsiella pneumoniae MGH 59]